MNERNERMKEIESLKPEPSGAGFFISPFKNREALETIDRLVSQLPQDSDDMSRNTMARFIANVRLELDGAR